MKTEFISLDRVRTNPNNPRQISKERFESLVNSILVLPRMLELRPIVVDDSLTVLGGNMRRDALAAIGGMGMDGLRPRLSSLRDFLKKPEGERAALLRWWEEWLGSRRIPVIRASELSEDERREFIIKDNAAFGDWDRDVLANEWDAEDLLTWGVDVWNKDNDVNPDDLGDQFSLPDSEKGTMETMSITFANQQAELVRSCIDQMLESGAEIETFGNGYAKGNALYEICRQWAGRGK